MGHKLLLFILLLIFLMLPTSAHLVIKPIKGESLALAPNQLLMTVDDAPDRLDPDGQRQTFKVARYFAEHGIRAVFFLVGCHFQGQPPPDYRSLICREAPGEEPVEIIQELVDLGHEIGNHTSDHIPLIFLEDDEVRYQVRQNQLLLDNFQTNSRHLFRPPGLLYNDQVFYTLNFEPLTGQSDSDPLRSRWLNQQDRLLRAIQADPYLRKLTGPIDQDAGGQGRLDGQWIGGDWDCYRKGYSPEVCGELYVKQVLDASWHGHGSIVLTHVRTEYMSGADGSRNFPIELAVYLVKRFSAMGYVFVPPDVIKPS